MVLPCTAVAAPADAAAASAAGGTAAAPNTIKEGDLVIVYESFQSIKHVYVDPKAQFQNRYGAFAQKVRTAAWKAGAVGLGRWGRLGGKRGVAGVRATAA